MTQNTPGRLYLVGLGPGGKDQMTLRARAAIAEADVVIGYATYVNLVADLLDNQEVVRMGMTEELSRSREAWRRVKDGKTVALISSGDIGVYGMAGPTFETLLHLGWTPDSEQEVEVILGASALNSAASLVGAPLAHDFCAISLSDQLTPWPRIASRLEAAAEGDFVVALYNPKSRRRSAHLAEASRILRQHRSDSTPVAIVRAAYREDQRIERTTLASLPESEVDMLCTVLIGNSQSLWRNGLMITPRGYHNKYRGSSGDALGEERAGRPLRHGLLGWPHRVREHLASQSKPSLEAAAAYFETGVGEVLRALASLPSLEHEKEQLGFQVSRATRQEFLRFGRSLKRFTVSASLGGAGSMCLALDASDLQLRGGRLELEGLGGSLTLELDEVETVYFVRGRGEGTEAHLLNQQDECLARLSTAGATSLPRQRSSRPMMRQTLP